MKTSIKFCLLALFFVSVSCNVENLDEPNVDPRAPEEYVEKGECETAFAYSKDEDCFSNFGFNRWGWVIGPLSDPIQTSYEIYAAAGKCDIDKGYLAGYLYVEYQDGTLNVTYDAEPGYGWYETHLYVGNAQFPTKPNGQPTVAPGQYGNSNSYPDGTDESSYTIENLEGDIYIIAHAVVCLWKDPGCEADAGSLKADNPEACLVDGQATISAQPLGDAVVPDGYEVLYVLTKFSSLFILGVSDTPEFTVFDDDEYRIHTLVYDPETLDLSGVEFGADVLELLIEGGGEICGSLDVEGALFKVINCGG